MADDTVTLTLWRPVGDKELHLIRESGWKSFPPRLPEQPIFYPVCNVEYARQIARDWNTRDGHSGYVLQFEVAISFISKYERQIAGSRKHEEYWIPAADLDAFNASLVGRIRVIEVYSRP